MKNQNKINHLRALAVLALATLNSPLATAFAQGSLTPPGAPGSTGTTMPTLAQIEPRTPISVVPTNINVSGSYYLTTNLTGVSGSDGIVISASDVTLDLNGFALKGVSGSLNGINVPNPQGNLAIRNGVLDSWGNIGVNAANGTNSQVERLRVSGCLGGGISTGNYCVLRVCTTVGNFHYGVDVGNNCTVNDCVASGNGSSLGATPTANTDGIDTGSECTVNDCTANSNSGDGIDVGNNCVVKDCTASYDVYYSGYQTTPNHTYHYYSGTGIHVGDDCIVRDCTANQNAFGINGGAGCSVNECTANNSFGYETEIAGISVGDNCTVKGCTANNNNSEEDAWGISIGDNSTVQNCTANSNEGAGIYSGNNCTVEDCNAINNWDIGISVENGCTVICCTANGNEDGIAIAIDLVSPEGNCTVKNCTANHNRADGIGGQGSQNRIDGNNVANNAGYGINPFIPNVGNLIIRNSAPGNSLGGYNNSGNNDFAPIQTPTTANPSPWANF